MERYSTSRSIWFRGSRKHYRRTIYTDGVRYFVKWGNAMIEVNEGEAGSNNWHTVEEY